MSRWTPRRTGIDVLRKRGRFPFVQGEEDRHEGTGNLRRLRGGSVPRGCAFSKTPTSGQRTSERTSSAPFQWSDSAWNRAKQILNGQAHYVGTFPRIALLALNGRGGAFVCCTMSRFKRVDTTRGRNLAPLVSDPQGAGASRLPDRRLATGAASPARVASVLGSFSAWAAPCGPYIGA